MLFKEIVGQEGVKKRLIEMAQSGRLPHAIMLSGREGVGKLPLALALAQYANCEHPNGEDACGTCSSCRQMQKVMHPDVHFVFPIVKVKDKTETCNDCIGVWRKMIVETGGYFTYDDWYDTIESEKKRAMIYESESGEIVKNLSMTSFEGGYKVMIIWQPEMMNDTCANKILKILEEPPEKTLFVMVSEHPEQNLQTIRSRVQEVRVPPIAEDDLRAQLVKELGAAGSVVEDALKLGWGSLTEARRMAREDEGRAEHFERFKAVFRAAYGSNFAQLRKEADAVAGSNREMQVRFLQYAERMMRESFVMNFGEPKLNYLTEAERAFAVKFSPFVNERNIEGLCEELELAERQIGQNVNQKMVFLDLFVRLGIWIKRGK